MLYVLILLSVASGDRVVGVLYVPMLYSCLLPVVIELLGVLYVPSIDSSLANVDSDSVNGKIEVVMTRSLHLFITC